MELFEIRELFILLIVLFIIIGNFFLLNSIDPSMSLHDFTKEIGRSG